MKKNKGFVFIETLLTVVVLISSLLLIYSSYSGTIDDERDRLYYDDVSYLYRLIDVKDFLINHSNIVNPNIDDTFFYKNGVLDKYIVTIGKYTGDLFNDNGFESEEDLKNKLDSLQSLYHIHQMVLVKKDFIDKCYDKDKTDDGVCGKSLNLNTLDFKLVKYLQSLNDDKYDYYLVGMFEETFDTNGNIISCDFDLNYNDAINHNRYCKVGFANVGFNIN